MIKQLIKNSSKILSYFTEDSFIPFEVSQLKTFIFFPNYFDPFLLPKFFIIFFDFQQMELLSQKENSIFLKNKMTPQDLLTLKQRDIQTLTKQLQLVSPKKHRFFMKQYSLEAENCQYELMISDIEDYYSMLTNQANKINGFLSNYSVDQFMQNLFRYFSAFSMEFCKKMGNLITKLSKKNEKTEVNCEKQSSLQCSGCKQNINDYRFSKLKQQLNLNHFQDRYRFFNIDNINYSELHALKRESNNIVQSQLGEDQNVFLFKGNCISLEQYQQVLNLLGSDLHQKNAHIQKIIEYLSQTDRKLINQDHFKQRESEEEMKVMQKMAKEDTIKGKLKNMIVVALRKYVRNKLDRMVDCEVQVNIKENEIIRELQKEKKTMKTKYIVLFKEKERLVTEYEGRVKRLQLELETCREEAKKEINKITQQGVANGRKYTEVCHLNEVYRLQIHNLTSQNTQLMANFSKQHFKNIQRQKSSRQSHSSNSTRQEGSKKVKSRARIKKSIQKDAISLAESVGEIQMEEKELDSSIISKANERKNPRKNSISRKTSLALNHNPSQTMISSQKDTYKYGTYEKIDEKQQQQELQQNVQSHNRISQKSSGEKPKMSRFKAIMTHFNSSTLAQQLNEEQIARNTELLKANVECKTQKQDKKEEQLRCSSKGEQRTPQQNARNIICKLQRSNLLQHLFESQRQNGRVQIQLTCFLQKYDKFISEMTAQKTLSRSTSVKVHDTARRKNRISTKYDLSKPRITSQSVEEVANNDNCQQKIYNKKSSHSSKRIKLQKIERKSQKELKKMTKSKKLFYFGKASSKTADNTARNSPMNCTPTNAIPAQANSSLQHSRVEIYPPKATNILTSQEIISLFLNTKNIDSFSQQVDKHQIDPLAPNESQVLMKIYAQMAHLHLKNVKCYQQLKRIIFYPKQTLENSEILNKKQSINHLKASLHYLTKIHRFCSRPKGSQQCQHLTSFLHKLISLTSQFPQ